MNHFSKSRFSQQTARGQALLLETSFLHQPPHVRRDWLYRETTREFLPLPDNGIQLVHWIEGLPQETLDSQPRIGLLYIHALLLTQQFEQAHSQLQSIEGDLHSWDADEKASIQAELATLRTYLALHQELTSRYHETIDSLAHFVITTEVKKDPAPRPLPATDPDVALDPLSKRELEVLSCIAAGMSNQEIAQAIVIAVGTVKRHINNIYNKLNVHSRIQAVRYAESLNLLPI